MATPNLLDLLHQHAALTPDAPCLTFEGQTQSFGAFNARANQLAHAFAARGIGSGDRVAIIARNAPAHLELFFACAKSGAILVPLNWRLAPREIAAILDDAEPALLIIEHDLRGLIAGCGTAFDTLDLSTGYPAMYEAQPSYGLGHNPAPDDPVLILYTSGTTGLPKGAMLSHDNLSYLGRMAAELWGFTRDSVNLVGMPLFHIGGIGYAMTGLSQGGHTVLLQQVVPAEIVQAMQTYRVTHTFFVPTVIQMITEVPGVADMDLTSLQRMIYGGAPIGEAVLKRAMQVFGCGFNHAYGMTETAGTVVTLDPKDHDPGGPLAHRLRSCGRPMPWAEIALVDPATGEPVPVGEVGEIRVRSAVNMLGYWRKPAETSATITADGWLCTGDAAVADADGYLYIHDRFKDMIVSGGENIYPTEIENVLYDHPAVEKVAVIGIAHPRWGETPCAYVIRRDGATTSAEELISYTRDRLAHFKCPSSIVFVRELPLNAAGKILKRAMRDAAWQAAQ